MERFQKRRDEMIMWLQGDNPSYKRMEEVEGWPQDMLGRLSQ
jgi:hypothetical protein